MQVLLLTVQICLPWVHSLKEKRSESRQLLHKLRHRFNVSIVESDTQEIHQTLTLSIASIAFHQGQLSQMEERYLAFIQGNTQGEIIKIHKEVL